MAFTMDPPPPPPPDWLQTSLNCQFFFSFSLAVAGFCHVAAHGMFSRLFTGIYVGFVTVVATYFERWILSRTSKTEVGYTKNQLRACQLITVVALLLCAINIPVVSLFSMAYGDAFGRPFDPSVPSCFFCMDYYGLRGANVPALICDGALLLFGMITSLLLSASGSYYWTLIMSDKLWFVDRTRYMPALANRL